MSEILRTPRMEWVGGDYPWVLRSPMVYRSSLLQHEIRVPKGYQTDLASVPRVPLVYWTTGGRANMAAILHDYLYDCCTSEVTRTQADGVFYEVMGVVNDPPRCTTRWLMWLGVRLGGWRGWRRDTRHKCRRR